MATPLIEGTCKRAIGCGFLFSVGSEPAPRARKVATLAAHEFRRDGHE
jgi:hypothetical protein